MTTMKLPISFNRDSYAVDTIEEGTDEYYVSVLAYTMRIEPGELPISTSYGVSDPTFETSTPTKLVYSAARFVPEISIKSVQTSRSDQGVLGLSVTFERQE